MGVTEDKFSEGEWVRHPSGPALVIDTKDTDEGRVYELLIMGRFLNGWVRGNDLWRIHPTLIEALVSPEMKESAARALARIKSSEGDQRE